MLWRLRVRPVLKKLYGNLHAEIERDMKLMGCRTLEPAESRQFKVQ